MIVELIIGDMTGSLIWFLVVIASWTGKLCVFSYLGEDSMPWGCGDFRYYNATWDDDDHVPGIIDQALFNTANYMEMLYNIYNVPSVSYGIVYGSKLIYYQGLGSTDINSTSSTPTQDSIYRIGSVSKVWTTLLAFVLRDKGIISFDDPISYYNANFSIYNPWGMDELELNGQRITIKHLASQVSGLPREVPCTNATSDNWCPMDDTQTILAKLSNEFQLIHPTDVQASYSNLAYALLGNILSEYVNLTYEEALQVCN